MKRTTFGALALGLLLVGGLAWRFFGATAETGLRLPYNNTESVARGVMIYVENCASCHGVKADGKGQTAEYLKISPVNLSTMQQTVSDIPVTDRVLIAVDGRHKVGKGKERKMPVFSENLTFKTVYEITEYLRSIQK